MWLWPDSEPVAPGVKCTTRYGKSGRSCIGDMSRETDIQEEHRVPVYCEPKENIHYYHTDMIGYGTKGEEEIVGIRSDREHMARDSGFLIDTCSSNSNQAPLNGLRWWMAHLPGLWRGPLNALVHDWRPVHVTETAWSPVVAARRERNTERVNVEDTTRRGTRVRRS